MHRFVADLHVKREDCAFDWAGWGQAHVRVCDQSGADWFNCGVFAFLTIWCLARRATVSLLADVAPPSMARQELANRVARWRWRLVLWLRMGQVPL